MTVMIDSKCAALEEGVDASVILALRDRATAALKVSVSIDAVIVMF